MFWKDLKFGQKYEKLLCTMIQNEGFAFCNTKDYDVKMIENGHDIFYEVKTDRFTHSTNNLCIEFEFNGKPSGISTTKANYYAYFVVKPNDDYDVYIIPVKSINKRIKKEEFKRVIYGGDKKMSKFYLFDKICFEKFLIKSI
jgi:hypothetical protein